MILIVDCGYLNIYELENAVDKYDDYRTVALFDVEEEKGPFDGIIISNAKVLLNDQIIPLYKEKIDYLLTFNKPVLGIGFGHLLIGVSFGAFYSPQNFGSDSYEIALTAESPLLRKLRPDLTLIKDNTGSISIPPGFELIASSDDCINEGMQHRELPVFGVQFLPERSGNQGATIIENFVDISLRGLTKES
jgi:GMP synthase-like glutamine amidotransferase